MRKEIKNKPVRISRKDVVAYLVYALVGAVGVFFTGLSVFHVDIYTCDSTLLSWIFIGITIQIWLYLIFKNID